jgi:Fe-S-cluster containining protein
MRTCDGCTKCCEGYLPATIKGHSIYPGKPCHFVVLGTGCSIYEDRPERPCKTYECFWKSEVSVPENLKPSITNTIITWGNVTGFRELLLVQAGGYNREVVDWFAEYVQENNINATWYIGEQEFFNGSPEYIEKRREENRRKYDQFDTEDA